MSGWKQSGSCAVATSSKHVVVPAQLWLPPPSTRSFPRPPAKPKQPHARAGAL